ncbi:Receptor-like protein 19, partial [Linum perenne]
LDLSRNFLSGRIPASIGSLQLLANLDLSSNRLNGSLSESLVELRSLSGTLNLSWNSFSGEIPESYGRFPVRVSLEGLAMAAAERCKEEVWFWANKALQKKYNIVAGPVEYSRGQACDKGVI